MKRLVPLLGLLLSGCLFGGGGNDRLPTPPRRPAGAPPITLNLPTSRETQMCYADLSREAVRYSPLPDRDYGGGCNVIGAVQLIDIGVPVTGLKAMRCGLAEEFIGWTRNAVAPAAYQILGSRSGCRGMRSPMRSTFPPSSWRTGAASRSRATGDPAMARCGTSST